ncbi:MAG TPA: EAL domain-containing protein, partial [Candidatus Udaeobacter sp.]|nr:EAL domain-containing protein [Candidatus Udaeobacter sp.]
MLPKRKTAGISRLSLVGELRRAIVHDHLSLVYQPKVDLRASRITGVEALARWRHLELGWIPPTEFIPLAEETGFIMPLSLWVINSALRQCEAWSREDLIMSVAVNLSTLNLQATEFPEQVKGLIASYRVPQIQLGFEITETAIMTDPERAIAALTQMKDMGLKLSIDDFGTGHSSLAYLGTLPVHELKIDKSFIKKMTTHKNHKFIVQSIIDLAHRLGLGVVAEGVETQSEKDLLVELQCDEAQGFYFAQPLPPTELNVWLSEQPRARG